MQSVFRQVQDKQTCALRGLCSCAVYPSTGSGRTACNLPRPFLAPLAFRLGLGGNGSALQRACSYAVHPSTGSGRTACNLPRPFLAPLAFRLGLGGTAVLCRELAPTLFTLRQAQGERSCAVDKEALSLRQTELSSYVRWGCLNVPLLRCCRPQHVAHALHQG